MAGSRAAFWRCCAEFNHPVGIVTKNAMVERDLDILAPMARKNLVNVFISVNNLDHELARRLEPRCSGAARAASQAMQRLRDAGVPVGVLVAPVIPFLNDHQIEPVLEAAWEHGARAGGLHADAAAVGGEGPVQGLARAHTTRSRRST